MKNKPDYLTFYSFPFLRLSSSSRRSWTCFSSSCPFVVSRGNVFRRFLEPDVGGDWVAMVGGCFLRCWHGGLAGYNGGGGWMSVEVVLGMAGWWVMEICVTTFETPRHAACTHRGGNKVVINARRSKAGVAEGPKRFGDLMVHCVRLMFNHGPGLLNLVLVVEARHSG